MYGVENGILINNKNVVFDSMHIYLKIVMIIMGQQNRFSFATVCKTY